jgi:group I intron endonuclease
MKISGIYKITSPSGKIYIGESLDIIRRWYNYKSLNCKRQPKIYNSLKKYGAENHLFEIIEECDTYILRERERYWQEHYNCLGENGLNLQYVECFDGKQVHSLETIEKIRAKNLGKKLSDETKQKLSIAHKGKKLTEEHKRKISESNSGEKNYMFGRKGELNPNFGKEGMRGDKHPFFGLKGEKHHSYGTKASKETRLKQSVSSAKSKIVLDIHNGIYYNSAKEASKYYGYNLGSLRNMLAGFRKNKTNLIYV